MKYRIIICMMVLFILNGWNTTFAKKVITLPGLADPNTLVVKGGKVYVSDAKTNKLSIFCLKNSKLLKQLLKRGVGPQECQFPPYFQVVSDCLSVYALSPHKVFIFTKDGVFRNEFRVPINGLTSIFQFGKNYALMNSSYNSKNNTSIYEFAIYTNENKELKFKKLLYSFSKVQENPTGGKQIIKLIRDHYGLIVNGDKVFVGDSTLGLYVLIFDTIGNQIGRIKIPEEQMKISEQYKKFFFEEAKKIDPVGFEFASKIGTFTFPEYFPAFFRFAVDKGKIYFLTYKIKGDQREVIVADFKGNVLKKAYVPLIKMGTDETFSIDNDKFYYILENEDTEEYELHVADIK